MGWRLWRIRPGLAAAGTLAWIAFHTMPFFVGIVLRAIFDALSGSEPAGLNAYSLIAILAGLEAARWSIFFGAWVSWLRVWEWMSALLRANMLSGALFDSGPASERLPRSAGEAVTRFRDDVEDVVWFVDIHLDIAGGLVFAVLALSVMSEIDPLVTLVAILPLIAVLIGNRILTTRMRGLRRAYREAMATTTAYLGELFASTLSIKTAGAEERVVGRLREHNRRRNTAAIRDHVGRESLNAFNVATVEVAIGIMLLVAAPAMRRGEFTVGDLVLFTTYLDALSGLPRRIGRLLAYRRHASVAVERMQRLVDQRARPARRAPPDVPHRVDAGADRSRRPARRLDRLALPVGRRAHGALPVVGPRHPRHRPRARRADRSPSIAGEVGSGKTTLVRAPARARALRRRRRSGGTARRSTTPARTSFRRAARTCRRCRACSASRSVTTCCSGCPPTTRRSAPRSSSRCSTTTSPRCPTRSTPSSDRVACACRVVSSSAPPPRARSCATPSSSWSTTRRARSTWRPRS